MPSLQRAKLADIAYVGSSAGSIYANPSGAKTLVAGLTLFNGNTSSETIKIYSVPDSTSSLGTAGVSNQIMELSLSPKGTIMVEFPFPIVLTDTNDSIQASTTTASKVTVVVHGDTVA